MLGLRTIGTLPTPLPPPSPPNSQRLDWKVHKETCKRIKREKELKTEVPRAPTASVIEIPTAYLQLEQTKKLAEQSKKLEEQNEKLGEQLWSWCGRDLYSNLETFLEKQENQHLVHWINPLGGGQ